MRLTILRRNLSHECQMNMFDYEYVDHDKLSGLCFVLCFILAAQQVDRRTFFVRLSRSPTGLDLKETQGSLTSLHLSCAECVLLFYEDQPVLRLNGSCLSGGYPEVRGTVREVSGCRCRQWPQRFTLFG